jgi:hypothetical protein
MKAKIRNNYIFTDERNKIIEVEKRYFENKEYYINKSFYIGEDKFYTKDEIILFSDLKIKLLLEMLCQK